MAGLVRRATRRDVPPERLYPADPHPRPAPGLHQWRQFQYLTFRRSYEVGLGELLRWLDGEDPLSNPLPESGGASGLPTRPTAAPVEKRVKEEQWRQLQALAHEIAAELGRQSGDDETREVFRRFNRKFGLTTYKKLPRRQFAEGLAFLTAWLNEVVTVTPPVETEFGPVSTTADASAEMDRESSSTDLDVSTEPDHRPVSAAPDASAITLAPPLYNAPAFPGYRTLSPDLIFHEKTGIEFVCVPAGLFLYDDKIKAQRSLELLFGKTWAATIRARAFPLKTVELTEFWISRYPVTNAQYKHFLNANPAYAVPFYDADWFEPYNWDKETRTYPADKADHPVVLVSWDDAKAFCDWAGLRLPAEQEWEKAARGDKDGRVYTWGDDWVDGRCNTSEAGVGGTTRVGHYSPQSDSIYGCADMAGNVWEWTAAWYDQEQSGRVLRGGSWLDSQGFARVSIRLNFTPDFADYNLGFRPVAPVDSGY